jgi:glycosyltransferase involved in cell wall biosynthesis
MKSNISVIIPAYNAGQCIGRAIESVLGQGYSDYEVIVVDDGSTDNTAEIVRQYGDRVRYIHQKNAGVAAARNAGIAAAKGHWMAFLDADDEWLPAKLKAQMDLLARNLELRWCGANRFQSDGRRKAAVGNGDIIARALGAGSVFPNYFATAAAGKCPVTPSSMIIRKDVFETLGGFDTNREVMDEDLDMWLRIAHYYPQIGYIPEPLSINHLDIASPELINIRWQRKKGGSLRELIVRHMQLAKEEGSLNEFKPYAEKLLRESLVTNIYRGFKEDARVTVRQFPEVFPWYWRLGVYILTTFPKVTSRVAQTLAHIGHLLRFEEQITRRWVSANQTRGNTNG